MNGLTVKQQRNQMIPWIKWKWECNTPKSMGQSKSSPKREIHSITGLPQERGKIANKQSTFKPKVSRRREIKIRTEILKNRVQKKYKRSMKPRVGSLKR